MSKSVETTKEIPLAANEIAMCIRIAKIYSGIEYSNDFVKYLLKEAGIASGLLLVEHMWHQRQVKAS